MKKWFHIERTNELVNISRVTALRREDRKDWPAEDWTQLLDRLYPGLKDSVADLEVWYLDFASGDALYINKTEAEQFRTATAEEWA